MKKRSYKFRNFFKNTCARASFLIEGLRLAILLKRDSADRHFSVNFAKFLRTSFFTVHLWTIASDAKI